MISKVRNNSIKQDFFGGRGREDGFIRYKAALSFKRNNAPPFDKGALKVFLLSFPYTSMKEELPGSEQCLPLFPEIH